MEYISFLPDQVAGRETAGDFQAVVSPAEGIIVKAGARAEVGAWLEAEKAKGNIVAEEIERCALLPGFTDAHNHTLVYATFEMLNAASMLGCADKADALKRIKSASARLKDPEKTVFAVAFDSSKIKDLTNNDLDDASGGRSVFMLDVSLHSGIASSVMMDKIAAAAASYDRPLLGELRDNGLTLEEFTMRALEIVEADYPLKKIAAAIERKLQNYFEKGITSVHDMMPATVNQFIAALMLRKRWKTGRACDFPITKFYLNKLQLADVLMRLPILEEHGLIASGEFADLVGIKLFADGAFGSRTAKVSAPYADTGTDGMYFSELEELEEDVVTAMDNGLKHGAIHAIGDLGIKRAILCAAKWAAEASKRGLPMNLRIEHYALPLPLDKTLADTKALGVWLCIQPNFLLDYNYTDRLAERVRLMCPHNPTISSGIPTFFGTDGMPDSILFAIWLATHAVEPAQRLTLEECIAGACETAGLFENDQRGSIREGCKADLIVADSKLIGELTLSGDPDGSMSMMKMFELEGYIKKVFKNGEQVYPKKKPAAQ
ncbi:MAG: amidohydrolase family protein [bacterium]